jgi:hypothetical protein
MTRVLTRAAALAALAILISAGATSAQSLAGVVKDAFGGSCRA